MTHLCHLKVRVRVMLLLLCLFITELGIAYFVPCGILFIWYSGKANVSTFFYQVHLISLNLPNPPATYSGALLH